MNGYIPPRTRVELANPAPVGERHEQAKKIAVSLIGNGITPAAVFAQLREMYAADMPDRELEGIISWAAGLNPKPSGYGTTRLSWKPTNPTPAAEKKITSEQAIANVERWLGGFRCHAADLWHASPWQPLEDWTKDGLMFIAALYHGNERINIVTDFTTAEKDGELKANPDGAGRAMLRDDWMRHIREHGTPQSGAGAWIRMNPVTATGSGKDGAITDEDVTAHRFMLIESDKLPEDLALSFYAALPLPVSAILSSGGRGPHAWVRLDCATVEEYRRQVSHILEILRPFGIDGGNKNPSRLSRLPGALRQIGAKLPSVPDKDDKDGGQQRLYYINPDPEQQPIFQKEDSR